jgi:hypothetical protein
MPQVLHLYALATPMGTLPPVESITLTILGCIGLEILKAFRVPTRKVGDQA